MVAHQVHSKIFVGMILLSLAVALNAACPRSVTSARHIAVEGGYRNDDGMGFTIVHTGYYQMDDGTDALSLIETEISNADFADRARAMATSGALAGHPFRRTFEQVMEGLGLSTDGTDLGETIPGVNLPDPEQLGGCRRRGTPTGSIGTVSGVTYIECVDYARELAGVNLNYDALIPCFGDCGFAYASNAIGRLSGDDSWGFGWQPPVEEYDIDEHLDPMVEPVLPEFETYSDDQIADAFSEMSNVGFRGLFNSASGRTHNDYGLQDDVYDDTAGSVQEGLEDCTYPEDETVIDPPGGEPDAEGERFGEGDGSPEDVIDGLDEGEGEEPGPGIDCSDPSLENALICEELDPGDAEDSDTLFNELMSESEIAFDNLTTVRTSMLDTISGFELGDGPTVGDPVETCPLAGGIAVDGTSIVVDTEAICEITGGPIRSIILALSYLIAAIIILKKLSNP